MKSIVYVIDEKKRDLLGFLLLSKKCKEDFENQYFISSNNLKNIPLSFFKNKILIFNYLRENILHYLIAYRFLCNAQIVIYDTEGVGLQDGYYVTRQLDNLKKYLHLVNQYWLWGTNLKNKINENILKITEFKVTGCFKFEPENYVKFEKNYILINSNFSLTHPKYSKGIKDEIKTAKVAGIDLDQEEINFFINKEIKFKQNIKKIIKIFTNEKFILRPHPFESEQHWLNFFKGYKNIEIICEGNVIEKIVNSKLVIHNDCTTAIEAYFFGKPALSFGWLYKKKYDQNIPREFSYNANNLEDVINKIKNVKNLNKYIKSKKINNKILGFYSNINSRLTPLELAIVYLKNIKIKKREFKFFYFIYLFKYFIVKILNFFGFRKQLNIIKKEKNIKREDFNISIINQHFDISVVKKFIYKINY